MSDINLAKLKFKIKKFSDKQAEIEKAQDELSVIGEEIIKNYCIFKKGENVIYTEWWRGNGKDYFGKVVDIFFNGENEEAVYGLWKIQVKPTTKEFKDIKGSYNQSHVYLGKDKRDKIRKA